jgi:glycerol-3-phosphate dehydrogenase
VIASGPAGKVDAWATDPDLVVIGAGVNGAAVAREATLRGLRTLLIDERDLAAGTSAASSRMIHGGPRYLEHGELRLVRQSLRERERLLACAPHLVSPYPLLIPFYAHNRRRPAALRAGMLTYDLLSWDKSTPWHRTLRADEVLSQYPGLDSRGLLGAVIYVDAYAFFAERLAVEQALDVDALGGRVLTHVGLSSISAGRAGLELTLLDSLADRVQTVRARAAVNAAGPWVDDVLAHTDGPRRRPLVGAIKGSHVVLGSFPGAPDTGIHYEARSDGRPILVLPQADGSVLVGSTEVLPECDPGALRCSDEEISYLLAELNGLIPDAAVSAGDVLHSFAGARPLPYDPRAASPAQVSRDHHVVAHPGMPGLFSLVGGKLTTHRALGELAIKRVLGHLADRPGHPLGPRVPRLSRSRPRASAPTRDLPLPGGRTHDWAAFAQGFGAGVGAGVEPQVAGRLLSVYGVRAQRVVAMAAAEPALARLVPGTDDVLAAEVALAFEEEFAQTLEDVLARRLMLARRPDVGLGVAGAVAEECASLAGWDQARVSGELLDYRRWAERMRPRDAAVAAAALSANHCAAPVEVGGR